MNALDEACIVAAVKAEKQRKEQFCIRNSVCPECAGPLELAERYFRHTTYQCSHCITTYKLFKESN